MWRKYHRVVSLIIALPFAALLLTGILLQLRQQLDVIQPKAVKMEELKGVPFLSFEQIVEKSGRSLKDIDQIILKPKKFHLALRLKDGHEMQMHPQTGEVLKVQYRWTNVLIDIHQGSIAGAFGQYLIILPTAFALMFLLISGLVIYPWRKFKRG